MTNPTLDDEVTFITGVDASGNLAPVSFWSWDGNQWNNQFNYGSPRAEKWGTSTVGTAGGTVRYYFDTTSNWTTNEQGWFVAALSLWSAVANISFVATTDSTQAQITFTRGNDGGAWDSSSTMTSSSDHPDQILNSKVSIDTSVTSFAIQSLPNFYNDGIQTVLHEIGHALGLGHAGVYNGFWSGSRQYSPYDVLTWSLMSYIHPSISDTRYHADYPVDASLQFGTNYWYDPTTPMEADIMAIQRLYGAPTVTPLSGGQIFGFNCNITGAIRPFFDFTQNVHPVLTIWDAGTNNTLDLSGYTTGSTINLNPGTFSSCGLSIANICIDPGTVIETAIGGSGNDMLIANSYADRLVGNDGNDTFVMEGSLTNADRIEGGAGYDTVVLHGDYSSFTLSAASWTSIEGLTLGAGYSYNLTSVDANVAAAQTLTVDASALVAGQSLRFNGSAETNGAFVVMGGDGDDTLTGGAGIDTVSYLNAPGGVTVSLALAAAQAVGGGQGSDTLSSIENLSGSMHDDVLTGSTGANLISGGAGDDVLDGGLGNDVLNGGSGTDRAIYSGNYAQYAVTHNSDGSATVAGPDGTDTIWSVERLQFADQTVALNGTAIAGTAGNDTIYNYDSHQTINALAGDDMIIDGGDSTLIDGGPGTDFANLDRSGVAGDYSIQFVSGTATATAASDGTTLNNVEYLILTTGSGNDSASFSNLSYYNATGENTWTAGSGSDTATITLSPQPITPTGFSFWSLVVTEAGVKGRMTNTTTHASEDVPLLALSGVENFNITGSPDRDFFNIMTTGTVTINGGAGLDQFRIYNPGTYIIDGGAGPDWLDFYPPAGVGGVSVDLGVTTAQSIGGGMHALTVTNVENAYGSGYDDTLIGNSGDNYFLAGSGDDTLAGRGGNDSLDGETGMDTVTYASATGGVTVSLAITTWQSVGGGEGTDELSNIENLTGSAFDDVLTGDGGNNLLTGGAGDDILDGGAGDDVLNGGEGNDVLNGGSGSNTAVYSGNFNQYTVIVNPVGSATVSSSIEGTDTLWNIKNLRFADQTVLLNGTAIAGTGGNDVISNLDAGQTINAFGGNDQITDGGSASTIDGGADDDQLTLNRSSLTSNVTLTFTSGSTTPVTLPDGTSFVNIEHLNLTTGSGNDAVSFIWPVYDSTWGGNSFDGGAGTDTGLVFVEYDHSGVTSYFDGSGVYHVRLGTSGGNDLVSFTNIENVQVDGGYGDDNLTGGAGNDIFAGNNGSNTISGGAGNDVIDDAGSHSVLDGGTGIDVAGIWRIGSTSYSLTLNADGSGTTSDGTTLQNFECVQFHTEDGNDSLTLVQPVYNAMWWGYSTWDAGNGNDTLTLDFTGRLAAITTGQGTYGFDIKSGGQTVVEVNNVENYNITTGDSGSNIVLGSGNDVLTGGSGHDIFNAGGGLNTLSGGGGDDELIDSGAGSSMDGGAGHDKLTLDRSALTTPFAIVFNPGTSTKTTASDGTTVSNIETLVLATGSGADTLTVNNPTYDSVWHTGTWNAGDGVDTAIVNLHDDTRGVTAGGAVTFSVSDSSGTLLQFGNVENFDITGSSNAANNLAGNAGNDILIGGAGADTLNGGAGADNLQGGAGNDTLYVGPGDTVDGGDGNDTAYIDLSVLNATLSGPNNWWYTHFSPTSIDIYAGTNGNATPTRSQSIAMSNVENFVLTGTSSDDIWTLGYGNYTINSGGFAGNEDVGPDWTDFPASGGVTIDLALRTPQAIGGGYGTLTLQNDFTQVWGTPFNDNLYGNSLNNTLLSFGGNDLLDGRGGSDTADYTRMAAGVTVDLRIQGTTQVVDAAGDTNTLASIENLTGSPFDDTLTGDVGNNKISGGDGNDTFVYINGAMDSFNGGAGSDTLDMSRMGSALWFSYTDSSGYEAWTLGTNDTLHGTWQPLVDTTSVENVVGTSYNDVIYGNADNNTYTYTGGFDVFNGGAGSDTLDMSRMGSALWFSYTDSSGYEAWTLGTNDTLHGTWQPLVDTTSVENVIGTSYNDVIYGNADNNTYTYTGGFDVFNGGAGSDTLDMSRLGSALWFSYADSSGYEAWTLGTNDTFHGTWQPLVDVSSVENVIGTPYNDVISGNADNNTYTYTGGFDIFDGGAGSDTLDMSRLGSALWFSYSDSSGYEAWTLGTNDTLHGTWQPLVDTTSVENVVGTPYNDKIVGNADNNTYTYTGGFDIFDGGAGSDTLDMSRLGSALWFSYSDSSGYEAWTLGTNDTLHGTWQPLVDTTSVENVIGTSYNDVIYGNADNNTYTYTGGFDIFDGGVGSDTLDMSRMGSALWFSYSDSSGYEAWTLGTNDTLHGTWQPLVDTTSVENVVGTSYNDVIYGNADNNTYTYTGGFDVFNGGAGSDTLDMSRMGSALWFSYTDSSGYEAWTLGTNDTLHGTWQPLVDTTSVENVIGTSYNDVIYGNADNNTYTYTGGFDVFNGGAGSDTLDMSRLGSALWFSYADSSGYEAWTLGTNDTFHGTWQPLVDVSSVENVIGTPYNDVISGNADNNTYTYTGGFDIFDGGAGSDTLDMSRLGSALWFSYSDSSGYEAWTLGTNDTLHGTWQPLVDTTSVENVVGTPYNDKIVGNADNNTYTYTGGFDIFDGGAGSDTLDMSRLGSALWFSYSDSSGYEAWTLGTNDTLHGTWQPLVDTTSVENVIGTAYNDVIYGNADNNHFSGGAGDDFLTGGGGNDTFSFTKGDGLDVIGDFTASGLGADVLDLHGYGIASFSALAPLMSQSGADTVIAFDTSNHITLQNVQLSKLNSASFLFS